MSESTLTQPVAARIPVGQINPLRETAERAGLTVSSYVAQLIGRDLRTANAEQPRAAFRPLGR